MPEHQKIMSKINETTNEIDKLLEQINKSYQSISKTLSRLDSREAESNHQVLQLK